VTAHAHLWTRSLEPARRAALRDLHRLNRRLNLVPLLFFGLWALGAGLALATSSWWTRGVAYVVSGVAIHALATLMHEASHGNMFRDRRLDGLAAFVLGAPALLSGAAYRVVHLEHHRYLRTPRDPEEFTAFAAHHRWLPHIAFYVWAIVGGLSYILLVPVTGFARGTRRQRVQIVGEYLAMAGLYAAFIGMLVSLAGPSAPLHVLVGPWLVTVAITNVRGWAEHPLTEAGHPLTQTRTVVCPRVLAFLLGHTNYHLEHHLFPGIPWYRLPQVHTLLLPEYRTKRAFVEGSYGRFLLGAARDGVYGEGARLSG
jgi:fatty acid desaturase